MTPALILMLLGAVAEFAAVILLGRHKGFRTLPIFCTFLIWSVISDLGMYFISQRFSASSERFYYYYVRESIVDSILQFAVLVELSWSVLRPIRASLPRAALWVLTALIAVAGLIIWPLASKTVPPNVGPQSALVFHLESTFSILRVACFIVMASFSQLLSIGWRDRELQIASGFGFYSIVSLLVALVHSHQLTGQQYNTLDLAESVSYLGTLTYWVYSFATKVQERKEFSPQMQHFLLLMGGGARSGRMALTNLPPDRYKGKDS